MGWQYQNILARQVVIVGSSGGLFVYSPTTGFNNLVASIAGNPGVDPYGNSYLNDVTSYSYNSSVPFAMAAQLGAAAGFGVGENFYTAPNMAGPWSLQATMSTDTSGVWSFNCNSYSFLSSGSPSQVLLKADSAQLQRRASTWSGYVTSAQTNAQQIAITGSVFQNMTTIYTLPANDANVNTTYRLTAGGFLLFGAALSVVTVQLVMGGLAIVIPIGSAEFVVNSSYGWRAQGEFIMLNGPENNANLQGSLSLDLGSGIANMATVAASTQTAGGFAQQTQGNVDMTVAHGMALQAKITTPAAGISIQCNYSTLERLGP